MIYRRIDSQNDPDISYLDEILNLPEFSRFINVDKNNYWTYVTNTENVFYFKVFENDVLVAATHCEISNRTLYMDISVFHNTDRQIPYPTCLLRHRDTGAASGALLLSQIVAGYFQRLSEKRICHRRVL